MRGRNKLKTMVMATVLSFGCLAIPQVQVVYGDTYIPALLNGYSMPKQDTLKKGDTFDLSVWFRADNPKDFASHADAYVSGSGTGGRKEVVVGEEDRVTIHLYGITYTGEGNEVLVTITQEGYEKAIEIPVELKDVAPSFAAQDSLEVSNSIINVVTGERQQISFALENNSEAISERGIMTFELADEELSEGIAIKTDAIDVLELRKGTERDYSFVADIDESVTHGIHEVSVYMSDDEGNDSKKIGTLLLKVDSSYMPPAMQITASHTTGFEVEEPQMIQIHLKNVGHVAAKNVKVEVTPNEKVIVADGSNVRYVSEIDSGDVVDVEMMLQVIDDTSITLPLQLNLTYIDDLGETKTDAQTLYLNVVKAKEEESVLQEVTLQDIVEPQGFQAVDTNFDIGFTLYAKEGADKVTVSVNPVDGIVPRSQNRFVVNTLPVGGSQDFLVTFMADSSVATGTHLIEIVASYSVEDEEGYTEEVIVNQFAAVSIDNPVEEDEEDEDVVKGVPKVIIGHYESTPMVVKAGESFDLVLGFLNTNSQKSVHNLKANLSVREEGENDTGSVFTPVNASNTFYIADMAPGEIITEEIRMYTLPSASPKTYEITIDMEYEDEEGNTIRATENFGIPVEQVTKIEVAEVNVEIVEVGEEAYLTARIYNTGKTDISNVKIRTEGEEFEVIDNIIYEGVMEQGAALSYEPILVPHLGGVLQGQIHIEYEDVTGTINTLVTDFDMEVIEAFAYEDFEENVYNDEAMNKEPDLGDIPIEEGSKVPWPTLGGVVVGVLLASGITRWVQKRRRIKEEMMFDED